jgi:hypothetical protein
MEIFTYFVQGDSSGWMTAGNLVACGATFAAFVAAIIAWRQLQTMAHQMRASTLMALDERWEGESLKPVRDEMQKLVREIDAQISELRPSATFADRVKMSGDMYPERLYKLQKADTERYERLLRFCGFFETVGYTAYQKYIAVEDVIELLGGSIQTASQVFENHIRKLQEVPGSERLYYYCLWLFDATWNSLERNPPMPRQSGRTGGSASGRNSN